MSFVAPMMRRQPLVQVTPELFWWSAHFSCYKELFSVFFVVSSACMHIPLRILALTAELIPPAWSSRSTLFMSGIALSTCESCHHTHTQARDPFP